MRNLKKVLTLVLTLAMLLSVMVVGAGAAFSDQDSIKNTEAVNTCNALNIINGENGSFYPTRNVTRAEMCKMICVALNGGREPALATGIGSTFTDTVGHWASPYIEYCVREGVVGGIGGGLFDPNGAVTGTQAAKMLLVAMGYNASRQGYVGSDAWELNINGDAAKNGLYDGLANIDASAALNRDNAAQIIYNALEATMVEYVYSAQTVGGTLTMVPSLKDQTYLDNGTDVKETILHAKYGMLKDEGILTFTASAPDYNEDKNEYTYLIDKNGNGSVDSGEKTFIVTDDYTNLYMHNVKVLYKVENGKDIVYGIHPEESTVIASGIIGDIDDKVAATDTKVKINGTSYNIDKTGAENVPVYEFLDGQATVSAAGANLDDIFTASTGYAVADTTKLAYTFDLIDNTGDNRGDIIVVYPFTVEEVTFVGTKSFSAGTSYNFEDVDVYNGIAEDDWVKITSAANDPKNTAQFEKLDKVSATATAVKSSDEQINFGGTWFDTTITTANAETANAGDDCKYVAVNGYLFKLESDGSNTAAKDYVVVTKAATTVAGLDNTASARVLKSDGTAVDVQVSKVGVNAVDADDPAKMPAVGTLYTYKVDDDGYYELTAAPAEDATTGTDFDAIKTTNVKYNPASGDTNGFVYVSASNVASATAKYFIANDAVVFVKDGTDYSVITGEKLKANKGAVSSVHYVAAKDNDSTGYTEAVLAYVDSASLTASADNYAYVIDKVVKYKESDNKYYVEIKAFNGKDDVTLTTKSGAEGGGGLIDKAYALEKGDIFKYDLDENGKVSKLDEIVMSDYSATSGALSFVAAVKSYDGNKNIAFTDGYFKDSSGTLSMLGDSDDAYNATLTDDTVIIYVNSDTTSGAEGKGISLAKKDTKSISSVDTEAYYANVYVKTNANAEVELLVIDINNNILNID